LNSVAALEEEQAGEIIKLPEQHRRRR